MSFKDIARNDILPDPEARNKSHKQKICITAGDKTLVKYKQEKTLLTTCFNKPANSLRHFLPDKRSSTTGKQDLNKTIATDAI